MFKRLDPKIFLGQKFVLQAIGGDDYKVQIFGHTAGRIFKLARAEGKFIWFWTITGPICADLGLVSHGDSETLIEARNVFRKTFDRWLDWSIRRSNNVGWHD